MRHYKSNYALLILFSIAFLTFENSNAQEISSMLVGNNVWYINPSDQVWNLTAEAKLGSLRIGGNSYDRNVRSNAELLSYVKRIQQMKAQVIMQVPQGGPEADYTLQQAIDKAVALVTYFNKQNTTTSPITYWSIGNEPWLYYNQKYGPTAIAPIVEAYFKPIAEAMKGIDSTIKIYGPDFAYYIEPAINDLYGGKNDISGKIPGKSYYYSDGISWHSYPQDESINLATTGVEQFRISIEKCKARVDYVNALHNRTGSDAIQWGIGEFNAKHGGLVHSWENGHMFAGVYNYAMKYSATYATSWSMFENGGNREGTDFSFIDGTMQPRASYWHMKMIAEHFKGVYLDGISKKTDIMVFGAKKSDSISVMILNRSEFPSAYKLSLNSANVIEDFGIGVNADDNRSIFGYIDGNSTHVLNFYSDEISKISYSKKDFSVLTPPNEHLLNLASVPPPIPTGLTISSNSYKQVILKWNIEALNEQQDGILVERKLTDNTDFTTVGVASKNDTSFIDLSVNHSTSYTYRISSFNSAGLSDSSEELSITTPDLPAQTAFNGPHSIPGKIEAENFDEGEEGLSYHDSEALNQGKAFRVDTGVDIENCSDEGLGYNVGYIENGEWLEFSIDSVYAGTYTINLRLASNVDVFGRKVWISLDNRVIGVLYPTYSGGWQKWYTLSKTDIKLNAASKSILKLQFEGADFNVNWISFDLKTETSINEEETQKLNQFELFQNYPNPFNPTTTIQYSLPFASKVSIDIINTLGVKVISVLTDEFQQTGIHSVNVSIPQLASGVYFYRLSTPEIVLTKKMTLIK
jgi:hypothetical protein